VRTGHPVPVTTTEPVTTASAAGSAERAFSVSILVSAVRCTLTYVIFPWVLPLLGIAGGVGPGIGLVIGTVAIVANVMSIRRFWVADHRWKIPITVLNGGIIVLLTILVAVDLGDLL
jgi:hypothetical protein